MTKTAENETTKLLASALNTAATSSVTIGVLGPIAAAIYGVGPARTSAWAIVAGVGFWMGAATSLHLLGRRVLGGIIE